MAFKTAAMCPGSLAPATAAETAPQRSCPRTTIKELLRWLNGIFNAAQGRRVHHFSGCADDEEIAKTLVEDDLGQLSICSHRPKNNSELAQPEVQS